MLLAALLAGCTTPCPISCPIGLAPATSAELFLGRAIPGGGTVGEAEWQDFLAGTATPAFPEGLTVLAATGQWRAPDGIVVREEARLLRILLPATATDAAFQRIGALAEAYKRRFRQDSVLVLLSPACLGV